MKAMEFIVPIPVDHPRDWTVMIDGVEVKPGKVEIISNRGFGQLAYGLRPEGHDGWAYSHDGGAMTIPYSRNLSAEILVGLLREERKNMDGPIWDVPGGFVDPGEHPLETGAREFFEEVGLQMSAFTTIELAGLPTIEDRFCYALDPKIGQGNRTVAIEIPFALLQEDSPAGWRFRDDMSPPTRKALIRKGHGNLRFFPWKAAVSMSPDSLTRAAIAQLLVELL